MEAAPRKIFLFQETQPQTQRSGSCQWGSAGDGASLRTQHRRDADPHGTDVTAALRHSTRFWRSFGALQPLATRRGPQTLTPTPSPCTLLPAPSLCPPQPSLSTAMPTALQDPTRPTAHKGLPPLCSPLSTELCWEQMRRRRHCGNRIISLRDAKGSHPGGRRDSLHPSPLPPALPQPGPHAAPLYPPSASHLLHVAKHCNSNSCSPSTPCPQHQPTAPMGPERCHGCGIPALMRNGPNTSSVLRSVPTPHTHPK